MNKQEKRLFDTLMSDEVNDFLDDTRTENDEDEYLYYEHEEAVNRST